MVTILNIGLGLFVLPLAIGFAAGYFGHRRYGISAPIALTLVVVFAYGALMLYQALWALADWSGSVNGDNILHPLGLYNEDGRREFLRLTAFIFAIPAADAIAGIWAAALVSHRPVAAT